MTEAIAWALIAYAYNSGMVVVSDRYPTEQACLQAAKVAASNVGRGEGKAFCVPVPAQDPK